ncbi:hypothetical protein SK128_002029, partial [Halocaridina rubra]
YSADLLYYNHFIMSTDADVVRMALGNLLKQHAPNAEVSIDDIVVSYVSGVLEEVAIDEEEVDSAGMKDVISAYVPEFDAIPEDAVTAWVMDMVQGINEEKKKGNKLYTVFGKHC